MSLSSAFSIINSAFASNAAQSAVISSNISNANTPGYAREIANLITTSYGGSEVVSVDARGQQRAARPGQHLDVAGRLAQQALSDGLTTLAQTVSDSASATSSSGATQNGNSPSAMLANLQSALDDLRRVAEQHVGRRRRVRDRRAAISPRRSTPAPPRFSRCASRPIRTWRRRSRRSIRCSTSSPRSTRRSFSGLATGADVTQRRGHARLASSPSFRSRSAFRPSTNPNGSTSIYTDSGVTLFQDAPQHCQLHADARP